MITNRTAVVSICLFFSMMFTGCFLNRGGEFELKESNDAALIPDQDSSDADSGSWPETGTPDADAFTDVQVDSPEEVALDSPADVVSEADAPEDSPLDVVEEDSPLDVVEEDSPEDSPIDAPEDVIEADASSPVLCFGVPTENGKVMICGEIPGGTAKSLMFKAEVNSSVSGQSIPFKSVCWSEVGIAELACFPCPGPNLCWPIPGGGFPHVSVQSGDVIKFQPGIADGPGLDMKNTLCDLGSCYQGRYIVYSGDTEVCRVNPDGTKVNATYEGSGTNVKIVCTL